MASSSGKRVHAMLLHNMNFMAFKFMATFISEKSMSIIIIIRCQ